uniref:glucuronosyltransferase n=1 Tax=Meloidogyne incognita TaxID=6306 RepID=A0A914MGW5_MELIC
MNTFEKYDKCRFVIHGIYPPLRSLSWNSRRHILKNIYFYNFPIDQQKFLAQTNIRGFITAGDQKSFTQALYFGVPLILIPFNIEQKFNAKAAEYMGVGIVVDHTKFIEEFPVAVNELMRENQQSNPNTLIENANKTKEAINQLPNGQIQTFLETVEKAIEEKDDEEHFPAISKFEEIEHGGYKLFSVALDEFINSTKMREREIHDQNEK